MSLVKSWEVMPHLEPDVNNGIEYLKQIQLEERATDPDDADLVDGRIYHQTGVGLRIYEAGAFSTLGAAGASATTFVGLTDTPANFTAAANKIVKVNTGGTALEFVTLSGDITIGATGIAAIASGVIVNDDVKSDAAIAYSKLNLTDAVVSGDLAGSIAVGKIALTTGSIILGTASVGAALDAKTDGYILIGNGSTLTSVAVSGDIAITNLGAVTVDGLTFGSDARGDIAIRGASAWGRVSAKGAGYILIGDDTDLNSVELTGDVSISTAGVSTVTDLSIASEADGDILYRSGGAWVRLAKGTSNQYLEGGSSPSWSLPALAVAGAIADGAELVDAGANDATIAFTTQGTAGASVIVPNFGGATANTFAFINFAQTWTAAQTVEYGLLYLGDSDDVQTLQILVNENLTGDKTLTYTPNDGDRIIDLSGNISFSADIATTGAGTLTIACGAANRAVTLAGDVTLSGALITAGDDSLTFTTTNTTDVTLPTTGTLATLAGAEAFTNKTLTLPKIATGGKIVDANGAEWIEFLEDATPVDHLLITQGDAGVGLTLTATSSTDNSGGLLLDAKGTGDIEILDGSELTFRRASFNALIVVADQSTEAHTFNIPDIATGASDTFAFLAEAQTLTNKTIDVDANTVTNINADELDPVGNAAYGVPFLYRVDITDVDGDTTVVSNSGFKFRVIDAWSVNTSGNGGVWSLKTDSGKCTDDVTVAANDLDVDRPTQFLDNMVDVAATTGDLYITSDATLDAIVYILCLRID